MASIPRGIRVIDWRNADRSKTTRYRVRVEKQNFNCDRSFADLELAVMFLEDTKTLEGQLAIQRGTDRATTKEGAAQLAVADMLTQKRITLGSAISLYIKKYLDPDIEGMVDKKRRTAKVNRDRLKKCKTIQIGRIVSGLKPKGAFADLDKFAKGYQKVAIGDCYLDDLTVADTTEYIRVRLADKKAKSTIKREMGAMQSVVNKLAYTSNESHVGLKGHNPFVGADYTLLKGGVKRRRKVITPDEEQKLLDALNKYSNPEVKMIFCLTLATGMRRAEVLALEWKQVDLERGVIYLEPDDTKGDSERMVILLPEAVEVLRAMPRTRETCFGFKIEGFKTVFRRVIKASGVEGFRGAHDLRRSFISRIMKEMTSSPVAIAEMMGVKHVDNLKRTMIEPLRREAIVDRKLIDSEEILRMSVGHTDERMTQQYTNIAPHKKE